MLKFRGFIYCFALIYLAVCPPETSALVNNFNNVSTTTSNIVNGNSIVTPFAPAPPAQPAQSPAQRGGLTTPSDADIASTVILKISQDGSMAGAAIRVTCQQGIVSLQGNAKSMAQVTEATNVARSVPGVLGVNSTVTINSVNY